MPVSASKRDFTMELILPKICIGKINALIIGKTLIVIIDTTYKTIIICL